MESGNWQRVKAIFDSAFELAANDRNSFLKVACAEDEDLRQEVEDLLAASDTAGSFMEVPFAHVAKDLSQHDAEEQLVPGQIFGRYKIIRRIGVGGMGQVFRAHDSELDRPVAIKILHIEAAADKARVRRFVQEARSASALNHPNILTVYEIGNLDGSQYIATEMIKGETLRDRLNRERPALRETLDVTVQVAAALNAAHEEGIIHRDIKPENIMLRDDDLAKVLDFGLAKLTEPAAAVCGPDLSEDATHVDTAPGIVMGTVHYMSPEQVRGKSTDARTDVWSLAIVLYEMLSQRRPFGGETASDTMAAILTGEPVPLDEGIPLELQRIIKKSLQKKPDERYQTVKDLLLDVKNLNRELEFSEELERFRIPAFPKSANVGITQSRKNLTESHEAAISMRKGIERETSGAEHLIRKWPWSKIVSLSGIFLIALIGAVFFYGYSKGVRAAVDSVAVLPFVNAGGDPEQEYLSDGLSEALINNLSRLPELKVIARGSSFQFRGDDVDPRAAAKALGVKAIIMGRVTRHGDDLDISVEMINGADNSRIWGELYSRKAADAQEIQDEIARTISENLLPRLVGGQQRQAAKGETASPQAYDLNLRGSFLLRKAGQANVLQAVELFEQAISIDPNYARAYSRLSIAYSNVYGFGLGDPKEFRPKQETAVRKAIDLDPGLEDARNAMGIYLTHTFQWGEAEREYIRAIEINQNFAGAHANYARLLSSTKRHEQAVAETRRAIEIDPLRPEVYVILPEVLVYARRFDEAIVAAERAIEMNPKAPAGYLILAEAYSHKRMYTEAIDNYRRAAELDGDSLGIQAFLGAALAQAGETNKAKNILNKILRSKEYVSKADLARLYLALGEPENAVASLEKAYSERDGGMRFLAIDPAFETVQTDPRVVDILRGLGLPQ